MKDWKWQKATNKVRERQSSNDTYISAHLALLAVHDTNPQHQFLCVVIVEDAIQIVAKASGDLLGNLFHRQFLVRHTLAVQFDSVEERKGCLCA